MVKPRRWQLVALFLAFAAMVGACGSDEPPEPLTFEDPSFVELGGNEVTVDGAVTSVAESGLTIHRRPVERFDDPETEGHDGIGGSVRLYLACESDQWSIGGQTFTVDAVDAGIHENDPSLIERGLLGIDWGVAVPLNENGVHELPRECDGTSAEDYGGTHHSTQWFVELARAVQLLEVHDIDIDPDRLATYHDRVDELAERLADPDNQDHWEERWMVDDAGNVFTHKTYMRAAGLQIAASLSDDPEKAHEWTELAEQIARRGMDEQRDDGVNPERGGYDVSYQMYGTWLAQLYRAALPTESEIGPELEAMTERAIDWMAGRVDPVTGQVEIGESTRTCSDIDNNSPFESAVQVRVFIYQDMTNAHRDDLVELAELVDTASKTVGNTCPPG